MRPYFLTLLLLPVYLMADYVQHGKDYYKVIIASKPFGEIADVSKVDNQPQVAPEVVQAEANKIQLCAMTILPDGRLAVGLIDNGCQPPDYIVLTDGESSHGLTLILSDYEREIATFERDTITFTLKMGMGMVDTVTAEMLAEEEAKKEAEAKKAKPHNSLAEQLIAMQMSLPPDVEAPPLPIPIGDASIFTKKFDPDKPQDEPETDTEAIVQAGVAELEAAVATGESPQSYLQRLTEHRQAEVKRQQEEKTKAKATLDEQIATGQFSNAEIEALRRKTNIELIKKGVVPLSPVEHLTDEEQAEIDNAEFAD